MTGSLGLVAALAMLPVFAQAPDEVVPIQRHLAHLRLGDSLRQVQTVYQPTQDWSSYVDPRGRVTRYRVEKETVKAFPKDAQTLWLGFKKGRLVDIQVIYTTAASRAKSADELAGDMALIYGAPRQVDGSFQWIDDSTCLFVFAAETPENLKGGIELRTSMRIFDKDIHLRTD